LIGSYFASDAEVIAAVETWLDGHPSEFFLERFAKVRVWSFAVNETSVMQFSRCFIAPQKALHVSDVEGIHHQELNMYRAGR